MVVSTVTEATSLSTTATTPEVTADVKPEPECSPSPSTTEPAHTPDQSNMQLDLAFCCDCTGSMSSYIKQAQENIRKIASEVTTTTAAKIRFALVTYRDHPPQDSSYVTQTHAFTPLLSEMQQYVDKMSAQGGGDGPEAVADGLYEISKLDWRPNATKVCVLISDAPPHGLGESDDGFPNGCPHGHDPLQICRELATNGVTVYAVGVEPVLSRSYKFARDFMMSVAKITNGKYLPLGKADLLSKVIVGGCMEGLLMDGVWEEVEKELQAAQAQTGGKLSEAEVADAVQERLKSKGVDCWAVETDCPYGASYDDFNEQKFVEATSLKAAREKLDSARNMAAVSNVSSYGFAAQACTSEFQPISSAQVQRCARKKGFFGK